MNDPTIYLIFNHLPLELMFYLLTSIFDKISFHFILISNSIVCLDNFIFVRTIQNNAFKTEFKTIDDILYQPNLENVDYILLK